jgi:hypothetical protein
MKTIIATQLNEAAWVIGHPFPKVEVTDLGDGKGPQSRMTGHTEGNKITRLDLVGDSVEVWATSVNDPMRCLRVTLCRPTVAIVTSAIEPEEWRDALSDLDPRESVYEVLDLPGHLWRTNQDVPHSNGEFTIVSMARAEDDESDDLQGIEVFAMIKPGAQGPPFLHFLLLPFYLQQVTSSATPKAWLELQKEFDLVEDPDPGDDPDPDDDVEDQDELSTGGVASAQANGQATHEAVAVAVAPAVAPEATS